MKKYLFVGIALLLMSSLALAMPKTITVQGRLSDANDLPISGSYMFQFKIYDNLGNLKWGPEFQKVSVNDIGIFSVEMGRNTTGGIDLPFDQDYFLETYVNIGGNWQTFTPKVNITSSGYAFSAGRLYATGNSNMGGYNITNVGYLCLGTPTDCRNAWPTGGGGGAGWAVSGRTIYNNTYSGTAGAQVVIGNNTPPTVDSKLTLTQLSDNFCIMNIDSGLTAAQYSAIDFYDRRANKWGIGKDNYNDFYIDEYGVANRFIIKKSTGYIGIGNANPTYKLDVNGTAGFGMTNGVTDGIYLRGTDWADASIYFDSFDFRIRDQSRGRNLIERSWTAPDGDFLTLSNVQGGGASLDDSISLSDVKGLVVNTNGAERIRVTPTGNVGIGTSTPDEKLDVVGSTRIANNLSSHGINPNIGYPNGWGGGIHTWDVAAEGSVAARWFCLDSDPASDSWSLNCINSWPSGGGGNGWAVSGNNVYNDSVNVRVGIGTTNPLGPLHIESSTDNMIRIGDRDYSWPNFQNSNPSILFQLGTGTNIGHRIRSTAIGDNWALYGAFYFDWYNGTTGNYENYARFNALGPAFHGLEIRSNGDPIALTGGNIGIGTTTPGAKLDVNNTDYATGLKVNTTRTSGITYGILSYASGGTINYGVRGYANKNGAGSAIGVQGQADGTAGTTTYGLYGSASGGSVNWGLYVGSGNATIVNGNLGVGTTNPAAKLHVSSGGTPPSVGSDVQAGFLVNANGADGNWVAGSLVSGRTGSASLYLGDSDSAIRGGISYDNNAEKLYLISGEQTKLVIKGDNGFVGIGTTTPDANLHVRDGTGVTSVKIDAPTSDPQLWYAENGLGKWVIAYSVAGNYLFFRDAVSGRDLLRLMDNGDVWINGTRIYRDCPTGMGRPPNSNYCIDLNERSAQYWYDAAAICRNIGGRLPNFEEWFWAANNSAAIGFNNPYDDQEWTNEVGWHQPTVGWRIIATTGGCDMYGNCGLTCGGPCAGIGSLRDLGEPISPLVYRCVVDI